jgi:hypothetical protein
MKKKYIIAIALVVFMLSISTVSAGVLDGLFGGNNANSNNGNSKTEFTIYGHSPKSVESQVSFIENDPSFYNNNETRDWLKGLNNYVMYDTGHEYIVMDRNESNKIPVIDNGTDFSKIECNVIKCTVVETHSLGSGLKDCILVKNVEVTGNKTIDLNKTS